MSVDAVVNFGYSTVAVAPIPASSGVGLTVQTGNGALFPAVPFNATVWPAGAIPTAANAEIVRVTANAADVFVITRTQEGTSARTIVVGDQIAATITALMLASRTAVIPLTPTIQNSNGTTKTAILAFPIAANAMLGGYKVEVELPCLMKNAKGSAGTLTWEFAYGSTVVASAAINFPNNAAEGFVPLIFKFMRIGANLVIRYDTTAMADAADDFSLVDVSRGITHFVHNLTITAPDFTTLQTFEIRVTLDANNAAFYANPQEANVGLTIKG